jgi:hypothetical protein
MCLYYHQVGLPGRSGIEVNMPQLISKGIFAELRIQHPVRRKPSQGSVKVKRGHKNPASLADILGFISTQAC